MKWFVRSSPALLLCVAALLAPAAALAADSPRDELLRFVPDDVGFCFVLQDLRVHAAELADSPFVEQLRKSPLGAALQKSKELGQLDQIDARLRLSFGAGFDQLRDDLLGDAVVFAYRPGPPDKPDQEQGLILVRARTADVLSALVDKVNQVQKKDGTLTDLQPCAYNGTTYFRRVESHQTNFYLIRGPVLLFTGQEKMLHRAIDVDRTAASDAEPPLARRLREVGADRAVLALWVNPRAFDAHLEAQAAKAVGANAALQKKVLTYWKAVDGLAAWVTLDATCVCRRRRGCGRTICRRRRGVCWRRRGGPARRGATSPTTPCCSAAAASTSPPSWTCCRTCRRRTTPAASWARTSSRKCCPTSAPTGACA